MIENSLGKEGGKGDLRGERGGREGSGERAFHMKMFQHVISTHRARLTMHLKMN